MSREREIFKNHVAKVIMNTEDFFIADWANANGSSDYAIRYVLDIKKGILMITGDVGSAIASWYSPVTAKKLKGLVLDFGYFVGKIKCSTDLYIYREDDICEDLDEKYKELKNMIHIIPLESLRDDFEVLRDWCNNHQCADAKMSPEIEMICDTYAINLDGIGRRISPRVHLWAAGYQMLAEQLGI